MDAAESVRGKERIRKYIREIGENDHETDILECKRPAGLHEKRI